MYCMLHVDYYDNDYVRSGIMGILRVWFMVEAPVHSLDVVMAQRIRVRSPEAISVVRPLSVHC